MTKHDRKKIDKALKEGVLKSNLFQELSDSYDPTELRRYLASRPSLENQLG